MSAPSLRELVDLPDDELEQRLRSLRDEQLAELWEALKTDADARTFSRLAHLVTTERFRRSAR